MFSPVKRGVINTATRPASSNDVNRGSSITALEALGGPSLGKRKRNDAVRTTSDAVPEKLLVFKVISAGLANCGNAEQCHSHTTPLVAQP